MKPLSMMRSTAYPLRILRLFLLRTLQILLVACTVTPGAFGQGNTNLSATSNGRIAMMSPQFQPVAVTSQYVFITNTPNNTLDVIDPISQQIVRQIDVGIEPVGLGIRPDGKEIWVANHLSDSVSVIDLDSKSLTFFQVVHTIQDFDPKTKATRFDEPVGIVFANNEKAYVSLSSESQVAVIDVAARRITKRLRIEAQEPRGMAVRNGKLFVIPFESNNQTQLSGGKKEDIDGNLVTFYAWNHSIQNNNVLSIGYVIDIVKNPQAPDRDLFIFDTESDELIETVSTLGTLLYGIAVDSIGNVFIFYTTKDKTSALALREKIDEPHSESGADAASVSRSQQDQRLNGQRFNTSESSCVMGTTRIGT
ncbi:MAG: hypothetical protein RLY14_1911 [Planctomycetota bacterium]|jgi:YVTN family beta-propeller protein